MRKSSYIPNITVESDIGKVRNEIGRFVTSFRRDLPQLSRKICQVYIRNIQKEGAKTIRHSRKKRFKRDRIDTKSFAATSKFEKTLQNASRESLLNSFFIRKVSNNKFQIRSAYYLYAVIKGRKPGNIGFSGNKQMEKQFQDWAWQYYKSKPSHSLWGNAKHKTKERAAKDLAFSIMKKGTRKKKDFVKSGIMKSEKDVRIMINKFYQYLDRTQVGGGSKRGKR